MSRASGVGIKAIELYVPNQCVEQHELEEFDGVSRGKYTIGLGQTKMAFCDDREDIYSLALTAVSSLMRKNNIHPCSIGRLEVGTESLLDKSKSVKTVLMQLFEPYNTDIEGVDTYNACYGGTNAFLNAINWVESSSWDGRDAIVVAGDIAAYKKATIRATGSAGCVAMLVGPDAPLVVESGLRGSHFRHTYDFYKADFSTEYPDLDGPLSVKCYNEALEACYRIYQYKLKRQESTHDAPLPFSIQPPECTEVKLPDSGLGTPEMKPEDYNNSIMNESLPPGDPVSLPVESFDYMCFHAPTTKIVRKAYSRLFYNDYRTHVHHSLYDSARAQLSKVECESGLQETDMEVFTNLAASHFKERVDPSIFVPSQCGNMYTASVWSALCGLLTLVEPSNLQGKRIGMFSYGSGFASTMFSLRVAGNTQKLRESLNLLQLLKNRRTASPKACEEALTRRAQAYQKKPYQPYGSLYYLRPGTYYLESVDEMSRRSYAVKS
ncbi:hydroxymethylglutaryl- synthase [Lecanosticta acicola]|uniref:Hydroxymethylglutaryl-CoA synthase n=1 Tax=Lecanosticta acicola TaxID=111012 RepID=A0AAI8Z8K8_9PEZI|nr:hydroxymethylglutaryl- synthase [Lecanosticta acicola]